MPANRFWIKSVIRDSKGRTTHAKIGHQLYDIPTLFKFYKENDFRYFTSDDEQGTIERDVLLIRKKGGKYYFATEADWTKENNLDYLPIARLD